MTDRKESQSPQTSPRTKFPNVNSSMSNNASAIHEDDNLIREKNSTRPMNVLQDSRFKPSATKEERPIKYSVEHVALPVFKPTLRGKAISILRSKTAEITIVGLIILYMALVFINIIMDNGIEEDIHVFNAIRGLKFAELGILAIFIAEMLIKIWTFGFKGYFKDIWCIVDSLLVLITFGMIIVDIETEDERYPGMPRVKGLFRLFKVFVVIRKANDIVRISQSKIRTSSLVFKSPVEKVLELFHTFKRCTKDKSLIKQIDWAIEIVSSNRLYEPIIEEGKDEKNEVGVWVKSYQTKGPKDEKKQSTKDLKELMRRTSVMPAAITPSKVPNLIIPFEAREVFSKDIDHLHFDIMEVRDITKGQELAFTALYLFERHSFFDALNIKQETFVKFIKKVQSGYLPNPYHNPTHGADVLQSTNYFLTTGELLSKCQFTELEVASLFIGAAIHDYDHPGTNNAFHINTASSYAITYNDKGVLENHHVSAVFALLQNDSYNIFANFTKEDYKIIRERIIAIVLATDMASHFSDIAKLKGRLAADFDPKDKDKKFMMETIVHAADISNPSKPWDICKEWTTRIVTEFWNQGDKERELGLPITYLCDRYTVNTAKSQIGFIDFVVSPLFVLIKEILPKVDISHLEINKNKWKDLVDFYEQELKTINEAKKAVETKEIAP